MSEFIFDDDTIIDKIKKDLKVRTDKELARLIGLSQQNFHNRKKKGSVLGEILVWAVKNKIHLSLFPVTTTAQQTQLAHDGLVEYEGTHRQISDDEYILLSTFRDIPEKEQKEMLREIHLVWAHSKGLM